MDAKQKSHSHYIISVHKNSHKKNTRNFEPFKSFLSFVPVELKDRILQKAEELFFTLGFKSVTMDDIASELGISKKTIYQHFEDKNTLVAAVTEYAIDNEHCRDLELIQKASNPIEEILLSTQMMRDMLANVNPAIFHDLQKYYPAAWQKYLSNKDRFKEIVIKNLIAGKEQGYYREDIDVEILARLRIETVDLAFNVHVFPTKEFNLLNTQLEFIKHFIRGIVTEKGLKAYEATV